MESLARMRAPTDGSGYLLGALDTQIHMSIVVPDGNGCLEPGPLASADLLLHQHNLQNLVLEGCPQEKVNDLRFLDRQGEEIDLQRLDLHILDQAAQLGDENPLLVLGLDSASSAAPASIPAATPATTPATTLTLDAAAESSTEASEASHPRALEAARPSRGTGVICHLVFSQRSGLQFSLN